MGRICSGMRKSRKKAYSSFSAEDTKIVRVVSRFFCALVCQQESSPYIGRSVQHVAHMTQSLDQSTPPDELQLIAHSTRSQCRKEKKIKFYAARCVNFAVRYG